MKNVEDVMVQRYEHESWALASESIAAEALVHLYVNERHVSTLLASPENLDDLIIGHMATEYDFPHLKSDQIHQSSDEDGFSATLQTTRTADFESRSAIVTSSCGACDQANLSSLITQTPSVQSPEKVLVFESIVSSLHKMRSQQHGFEATGGMHAAGLLLGEPGELLVREDIGRHNAVDKVYGFWSKSSHAKPAALLLSGRCGWDIVAKAASMGTPVIASYGAASTLAAETARMANITLISFVRDGKAVVIGPVDGRFQRKH
tara:strand:- start:3583 stop:4371 length:789 start_codon:yes stop_codon:yes gene_type:complete